MSHTIQQWAWSIKVLPASMRARKYANWRKGKAMPEEWIKAIEAAYPPLPEKPLPGIGQQAVNAAKAVVRTAVHVATGGKLCVPEIEGLRRQGKCEANTCGFYRASDQRCSHESCGCFLKVKPWFEAERCPVGLW